MLSDDLRTSADAARLCAEAPTSDLRRVLLSMGDLLDRASDEAARLEDRLNKMLPPAEDDRHRLRSLTFSVAVRIQREAIRLGSAIRRGAGSLAGAEIRA